MTSPQLARLDEPQQPLRLNTGRERFEALLQEASAVRTALNSGPLDLWCSTPRKADKRRPRASLRALTHAERSTLAHRLARVLDAPAGKMRVAIDAAIDNGKVEG